LVGMMTEVIRVRSVLTNYLLARPKPIGEGGSDNGRSIYDFKRHAIQNCLYGVDIDPGAVEIAKLRLWLSLIVDEQDIKQIKPLPNLDYKIMQGNSLLEEYEGIKLFDEGIVTASPLDNTKQIEEIKQKLSDLQREFFKLHSAGELKGSKKQQIELELKKYNDWLNKLTKTPKVKADNSSLFDQMSEAKQKSDELKKLHKEFFETANKREKDEIKKQIEALEWELIEATLREQNKLSLLPEIEHFKKANIKPFFLWSLNFSEIFEKNKKYGFDILIGNPPYETTRSHGMTEKMKDYFRKEYQTAEDKFDYYSFFIEKSSILTKPDGHICLITPSTYLVKPLSRKIRRYLLTNYQIISILEFKGLVFQSVVPTAILLFKKAYPSESQKIKAGYDIKSISDFLDENFFTKTTYQSLFKREPDYYLNLYADESFFSFYDKLIAKSNTIKLGELAEIYNGIQTGNDKKYISYKKDSNEWEKVITGSDIKKYYKKWGGKYVYYVPDLLHSNTRKDIFKTNEKIIIRQTSDRIIGCYDNEQYFTLASTFVIKQFKKLISYEALLAILNSQLFLYLYRSINNEAGRVLPQIKKKHIFDLPIMVDFDEELLKKLVFTIQAITKEDDYLADLTAQTKVKSYEHQIDQLVYKLYGLTPEEIEIVEKKNS